MSATYDLCIEWCEDAYTYETPLEFCLDRCDEQFAAGREPSGDVQDLMAAKETAKQRTIDRDEREQVRSGWTDRRYRR